MMRRHYICVRQSTIYDCGIACLLTILRTYGGDVSQEFLRELTHTTTQGVTAYDLIAAAFKLGFVAKGVEGNFRDFSSDLFPLIAHVQVEKSYFHFVVIHKMNHRKQELIIADPAFGLRTLTFTEFAKMSTNTYILLEPVHQLPQYQRYHQIEKVIGSVFQELKKEMIYLGIVSFILLLIQFASSFYFSVLLQYAVGISSRYNLLVILFFFLLLLGLDLLFTYSRDMLMVYLSNNALKRMEQAFLHKLLFLPYLYYQNHTAQELLNRIRECESVEEFGQLCFTRFFSNIILCLLSFFTLCVIAMPLAILSLTGLLIYALLLWISRSLFKKKIQILQENTERYHTSFERYLMRMETVKQRNLEQDVYERLMVEQVQMLQAKAAVQQNMFFFQRFQHFLFSFLTIVLLGIAISFFLEEKVSFFSLFVIPTLLRCFFQTSDDLLLVGTTYQEVKVSIERLNDLFLIEEEPWQEQDRKYQRQPIEVCFRNFSFAYLPQRYIIKKINLHISKCARFLLMGSSGVGKSTLMKCLLRYYECERGMLFLNDKDICDYDFQELRSRISYVSSQESLFYGSYYDNMMLNGRITQERFDFLVRLLGIETLVANSKLGYDSLIMDDGANLSQGERARLLIARGLAMEKDVYIFDEVFSFLPVSVERTLLESIFRCYPQATIIIISHRRSNLDLYTNHYFLKVGTS